MKSFDSELLCYGCREFCRGVLVGTKENGFVRLTLRAAQCRDAHSTIPLPSASLAA